MNANINVCERFVAEGVWLWLDNDLSNVERKRWEAHLATCEACQHVLAETESTLGRYNAIEEDPPSAKSIEAILEEAGKRRVRDFWRPILAAAAAVILVVQSALPGWADRIDEISNRPLVTNKALEAALELRAKQARENTSSIIPGLSTPHERLKAYLEAPRFQAP